MLAFVIFTLNVYVTGETSLDPIDNVEIDEAKSNNDDVRNKRSGEFFSLLLKKKLGLIKSLAGVSSGKSFGQPANPFEQHLHPFQQSQPLPPLVSSVCGHVTACIYYGRDFLNCVLYLYITHIYITHKYIFPSEKINTDYLYNI